MVYGIILYYFVLYCTMVLWYYGIMILWYYGIMVYIVFYKLFVCRVRRFAGIHFQNLFLKK